MTTGATECHQVFSIMAGSRDVGAPRLPFHNLTYKEVRLWQKHLYPLVENSEDGR